MQPGLGYIWRVEIPAAGNGRTGLLLAFRWQHRGGGAESAVYGWLVGVLCETVVAFIY